MTDESHPAAPSLASAARYWFKLGCISFGGPAGQIALMHAELVERRRWISEQRFLHALNYCMLLPGPEATQLAIYIGWLLHRTLGGLVAGLLFILPALALITGLAWLYMGYGSLPVVTAVLYGVKPAIVAIVLAAAWRLGKRTLRNAWLGALAIAAFAALTWLNLPFPVVVLGAALAGWLGGRWRPEVFALTPPAGHASAKPHRPALIDDTTPPPPHTRWSAARLARLAGIGILLGVCAWALLAWRFGTSHALTQMGSFFTKAALLTFGGAYAVLPYVFQGAVERYQWLSPAQMMDGLALGETTPGPLIMVNTFVGFAGGWNHAGDLAPWTVGIAGALVATFFTFLPSFLFILAGGPLVESTRGNLRLTAPLTAISAAVVGVIASLAVFFGAHVFFPAGAPDLAAMLLSAACALALLRWPGSTIPVLVASSLAGLVLSYWHV